MKPKQLQQRNYTIGIPAQYTDNQNLYGTSTAANNGSSLLGGLESLLGNVVGGINNAINDGIDLLTRGRLSDNATALEQDRLSMQSSTSTTLMVCAALVIVVYLYFKK
ncbi:MAG: hypothetical protein J6V54_10745 [Bacteroidales bacterium]|nr:hypothetical protein [Bacteroidales bacterium]